PRRCCRRLPSRVPEALRSASEKLSSLLPRKLVARAMCTRGRSRELEILSLRTGFPPRTCHADKRDWPTHKCREVLEFVECLRRKVPDDEWPRAHQSAQSWCQRVRW